MVAGISIETTEKVNEIITFLGDTDLTEAKKIADELCRMIEFKQRKVLDETPICSHLSK